jgi:hypothetical protein
MHNHISEYKNQKDSYLHAFDFFCTMPWLSDIGKVEFGKAVQELIRRAGDEQ